MNGNDRSFAGFATNAYLPAGRLDGLNELTAKSGFIEKCVESVERPTQ
jgi:hypothetical protein